MPANEIVWCCCRWKALFEDIGGKLDFTSTTGGELMSKKALWLAAVNEDDRSDRLVAIAGEHSGLAKKVSDARKCGSLSIKQMSKLIDRIEAIRVEREQLLKEIAERWG